MPENTVDVVALGRLITALRAAAEPTAEPAFGFNTSYYEIDLPVSGKSLRDHPGHDCGKVCCIGGWTARVIGRRSPQDLTHDQIGSYLGLGSEQSWELFYPSRAGHLMSDITLEHAIVVLEHLRDTGEVDWTRGRELSA